MQIFKGGFHRWECPCGRLYTFYWRENGTAVYVWKSTVWRDVRVGFHPSHDMTTWRCICRRMWQEETPGRGEYATGAR